MRALVAIAVIAASLPLAASAAEKPRTITAYCSPSGDVCFGVLSMRGAVVLHITTAARYFTRHTICVRPPALAQRCRSFPLERLGGSACGSQRRHAKQFPARRPGVYVATWRRSTTRLGPRLRFLLPL